MENMIKAEELRLGNYVDVPRKDQSPFRIDAFESLSKTFIKVAMIHPVHGENFHPLTWYGDDLKPIPLTEEWLIKFGFEKLENFDVYENVWGLKGFMVSLDDDYINVFVDWADEVGHGYHSIVCYEELFVHTFQNLHFAITLNELTLIK